MFFIEHPSIVLFLFFVFLIGFGVMAFIFFDSAKHAGELAGKGEAEKSRLDAKKA